MALNMQEEFYRELENLKIQIYAFPWQNKEAYAMWLRFTYTYVVNSTRLLALAAGSMPLDKTAYSNRFIEHAAEEKKHELLLIKDLENLGAPMKKNSALDLAYAQSLFYWVSPLGNPLGLLGWVLGLEGVATHAGPRVYELVKKSHGEKCAHFLRLHAQEDPEHFAKALSAINELNPSDLPVVRAAFFQYCELYGQLLQTISERSETDRELIRPHLLSS